MSRHSSFRKAIRDSGGELEPTTESPPFDTFLRDTVSLLAKMRDVLNSRQEEFWPLGDARIAAVRNNSFNAFAHEDSGDEGIGIFSGLIYATFDLSLILWSSPEFLRRTHPIQGHVDAELIRERVSASWTDSGWVRPAYVSPRVPERAQRAWNTALTAISFICLHEIGHLVRAHVPHLRTQGNLQVQSLLELGNQLPLEGLALLRTLESDADIYAARAIADLALTTWNMGRIFPINHDMPRGTVETYLTDVSCGLSLAFFCMDLFGRRKDLLPRSTHPSPGVRLYVSYLAMMQILEKPFKIKPEVSLESMYRGFVEIKDFWDLIGLPLHSLDHDVQQVFEAAHEAYTSCLAYWSQLNPSIDRRLRRFGTTLRRYDDRNASLYR